MASSSATSATSASSRTAAIVAGQHVEEAVVHEAGLRVGVPDRVVQPGGQLERQLPVAAGADHRGQLDRRREQLGGQPAGPELGRHVGPGRARLGRAGRAPPSRPEGQRDLRVPGNRRPAGEQAEQVFQAGLRVFAALGDGDLDLADRRPAAQRWPRRPAARSSPVSPTRPISSGAGRPSRSAEQRSQSRGGHQQRADHFRVPGRCDVRRAQRPRRAAARCRAGRPRRRRRAPRSSTGTCVDTAMNLADATYGGQLCPIIGRRCPECQR